jgi:hypothetical protein
MEGKVPPTPDEYKYMIRLSQLKAQGASKEEIEKLEAEYDAQCNAYFEWRNSVRLKNMASK